MTLKDGLVGYWKFDGNAIDATGNGNDGTVNGATPIAGKINQGYDFDGINDYIAIPTINLAGTPFHISFWIKFNSIPSTTDYQPWLINGWAIGDGSDDLSYLVSLYDGAGTKRIRLLVNDGANYYVESNVTISTGIWYNIQTGYDGSNLYIQVNNETRIINNVGTITINTLTDNLHIGGEGLTSNFILDGIMDELGIYNKGLTTDESAQLYNNGNGLQYPFTKDNALFFGTNF